MNTTTAIAEKFIPKGFFIFNNGLQRFLAEPDTQAWYYDCDQDKYRSVTDDGPLPNPAPWLARVTTMPFELELRFPNLCTKDKKEVDLCITILCAITMPKVFLHEWQARLDASNRLAASDLEERITNQVKQKVADKIADYTYEELTQKHYFPKAAWNDLLADDFKKLGIELCEVTQVEYVLGEPDKFRAECEQRQKREQIAVEHEEALRKIQLETAERIRKVEHDHQLADERRQIELEKIRLEAERDRKLCQLKFEHECLKIEEEIACIRDQQEERERIKEERQSLEKHFELFHKDQKDILSVLQGIEKKLNEGFVIPIELIQQIFGEAFYRIQYFLSQFEHSILVACVIGFNLINSRRNMMITLYLFFVDAINIFFKYSPYLFHR